MAAGRRGRGRRRVARGRVSHLSWKKFAGVHANLLVELPVPLLARLAAVPPNEIDATCFADAELLSMRRSSMAYGAHPSADDHSGIVVLMHVCGAVFDKGVENSPRWSRSSKKMFRTTSSAGSPSPTNIAISRRKQLNVRQRRPRVFRLRATRSAEGVRLRVELRQELRQGKNSEAVTWKVKSRALGRADHKRRPTDSENGSCTARVSRPRGVRIKMRIGALQTRARSDGPAG